MKHLPHCFESGRRRIGGLLLGLAAALAGSCSSAPAVITEGTSYPTALPRTATLNIQVFRRTTELELTNTTALAIPASTLWLNAWYSKKIDGLGIGETLKLPLKEFKDKYGDPFRGGGFFATELPERLALAEIEMDGRMVGMVVVGGDSE